MKGILLLTWRYLRYHRARTVILVTCLTLTFLLPIFLNVLITAYDAKLTERARRTPLLLGPRGNQYELVLRALYFTRSADEAPEISQAEADAAAAEKRGIVIPLHLGYTARELPVVGTSLDYYHFRKLRPRSGSLPLRLGDAVVGHEAAEIFGLQAGDALLTDQTSLYNIAAEQPLKLRVTGILAESGTPDDRAVFVDTKTAWIIAGIGHGHDDLSEGKESELIRREEGKVVAGASVVQFREITEANIGSFHFHGDPSDLPLSAVIIVPHSAKDATLIKGRYSVSKSLQVLPPIEVIRDLLGFVFKIKRFFDASFALIMVVTILFLVLVMVLTMKLRTRERQTLVRIGCAPLTMAWLQAAELAFLFGVALLLACSLAFGLFYFTQTLILR